MSYAELEGSLKATKSLHFRLSSSTKRAGPSVAVGVLAGQKSVMDEPPSLNQLLLHSLPLIVTESWRKFSCSMLPTSTPRPSWDDRANHEFHEVFNKEKAFSLPLTGNMTMPLSY